MSVTTLTSLERPHYNLRQTLLQFASDIITICVRHYYNLRTLTNIAKCCSPYYKMRRSDSLQNAAHVITQCAHYYTMHTLLQNATIVITKCVTNYKMRRYYKMPQNSD